MRIGWAFTGVLGLIMAVTDSAGAAVVTGFVVLAVSAVAAVLVVQRLNRMVEWDAAPLAHGSQVAQERPAIPERTPIRAVPARRPLAIAPPE